MWRSIRNNGLLALVPALLAGAAMLGAVSLAGDRPSPLPSAAAGVANPRRAWQDWTLNCQGCHRPDGSGSAGTTPAVAGSVAKFLGVPGGRNYLVRVPGVATSPLADGDLSEVVNWMLWRFDAADIPADFEPYTAEEVAALRKRPLRLEAAGIRRELVEKVARLKRP